MSLAGRLNEKSTKKRDRLEMALFSISTSIVEVEEVILRNKQAMRRTPLVEDVLGTAMKRLDSIRESLRRSQIIIGEIWNEEQKKHWENGH